MQYVRRLSTCSLLCDVVVRLSSLANIPMTVKSECSVFKNPIVMLLSLFLTGNQDIPHLRIKGRQ